MHRYAGEPLRESCRIAVISHDALGNFVVATPLLSMLKARYPGSKTTYFAGARVSELAEASELIDCHRVLPESGVLSEYEPNLGKFDLIINLESEQWAAELAHRMANPRKDFSTAVVGRCYDKLAQAELPSLNDRVGELFLDPDWTAPDLANRHSLLQSGFIGEIFARLVYLTGPIPPYQLSSAEPLIEMPEVLVSMCASRTDKLWTSVGWEMALKNLRERGLSAGLLGAKPSTQGRFWLGIQTENEMIQRGWVTDLRGRLTLPEVSGALAHCRLVLTLDNGIMHMAASTQTPVIGLFRPNFHRLWAPPVKNLAVLKAGENETVSDVSVDRVIEAVNRAL